MRASRDAVARWNIAYAEQTAALFAAQCARPSDLAAILRLARAYHDVASAWRGLAGELAIPLWARHAAAVAAEEFDRRAVVESARSDPPSSKEL